jgi:hypothetical protein
MEVCKMSIHYQSKLRQHGSATLLVSLLILVGATLIVMFSARTSLMEQRISGNEIRTKQASNAAQAGLDEALAYLTNGSRNEIEPFSGNLADGSSYRAAFWDNSVALTLANNMCPDAPGTPNGYQAPPPRFVAGDPPVRVPFIIYSCGWSDDSAARQPMLITVQLQPPLPDNPPAPLIARGMVNTNGHARVLNYYTSLTVWAGQSLAVSGDAGTTFIRDPLAQPNTPTFSIADATDGTLPGPSVENRFDFVGTTVGNRAGLDVLMDDFDLGSRTPEEFFQAFMGATKQDFKNDDTTQIMNSSDLNGVKGRKIWVDGDVDISGNQVIGTPDEPVILVIDGTLRISGGPLFYGLLYVTGNMTGTGGIHFFGSTIVEGNNDTKGTPRYIYDPYILGRLNPLGPIAGIAGTWRDWLDR